MKDITKAVGLAVALVMLMLISMASAIAEHPKAGTGDTAANPSDLLSPGNEGPTLLGTGLVAEQYDLNASLSGIVPFTTGQTISYTVTAVGFREYLAAGWLDEQTQIILLYHDIDEPEARMRAGQFFTRLGGTATVTTPPLMT